MLMQLLMLRSLKKYQTRKSVTLIVLISMRFLPSGLTAMAMLRLLILLVLVLVLVIIVEHEVGGVLQKLQSPHHFYR